MLASQELVRVYPDSASRASVRVLTPGCGLARLTWEIAREGFVSQGNEFSYFMLLASYVILNWYVTGLCFALSSSENAWLDSAFIPLAVRSRNLAVSPSQTPSLFSLLFTTRPTWYPPAIS